MDEKRESGVAAILARGLLRMRQRQKLIAPNPAAQLPEPEPAIQHKQTPPNPSLTEEHHENEYR
jgi:hypothetical protein